MEGGVIEVAFFDDAVFQVLVQRTELTSSGGVAYIGKILRSPMNPVIIVDNDGVLAIMLVSDGRRFSIHGSPEGGYLAREVLDYDRPDHPPTKLDLTAVLAPAGKAQSDPIGNPPPPTAQADDGSTLDIIVMYTAAARLAQLPGNTGTVAQMNANIDAQIALTNTIYANSNVVQRLRLVYKGETDYTEVNMDTDLPRVRATADGFMDEVPVLRNLYAADFVSLWGVYTDYCGLGYIMTPERAAFSTSPFNVVASPDCTGAGSYTFAHELGHNMGLRHDNYADHTTTTIVSPEGAPVDPGTTSIIYAHGYVDLTNRFRTVMSYNDQCVASGFNCQRIPYFSNPAISFNNNAYYAPAILAATGDATNAHERQALNDTRETTANFRASLAVFPPVGPGVIVITPNYYVGEGAGSVVVTARRHSGSSGIVSVQFATAPGTAGAGSDYTHTTGTLTWADGDVAAKTITVPILQDTVLEGNETFTISLTAPTGGATIGVASSTVTILDDEPDTFPVGTLLPGGYVSPNNPTVQMASTVWSVDLTGGFLSTASLRSQEMLSANQTDFVNSDLEYTGVFQAGNVAFQYKMSAYHNGYHQFEFMIDGVAVFTNTTGGEVAWTAVSQAITQGTHTLRWRHKSRLPFNCAFTSPAPPGGANCKGRTFIDSIVLPLARAFDLSGDGRTDIVWKHTDGRQAIWLMNGTAATATSEIIGPATGWSVVQVADFDGDGKNDLVWQHTDGRVAIYLMDGTVPTTTTQILNAGAWSVIHAPDLNGDGKADLVFQNTDGSVAVWTMNGATMTGGASIIGAGTGWSVIKTGDFDGDGKADLLWKHTDGRHAIWLMNGAVVGATTQILNAGGWTAMQVADLNGDGRADIVWQHTDGTIAAWLMNGATMASGIGLLPAASGWTPARTGDFDGDGKADILFMHTDGRAAIYLMNGLTPKETTQVLNAGGGWTPRRTGDLNADGKADIVWENVDGRAVVWLMNGTALLSPGVRILVGGTGWSVTAVSQ